MKGKNDLSEMDRQMVQGMRQQATSKNGSNWSHRQDVVPDNPESVPLSQSVLNKDLIDAYKSTCFHVLGVKPFVFVLGEYSPDLAALMLAKKVSGGAFITAFNPYSISLSKSENITRNDSLRKDITQNDLVIIDGYGENSEAEWEKEDSYLILGLSLNQAKVLGVKYEQNAIVWVNENLIPDLVLLR